MSLISILGITWLVATGTMTVSSFTLVTGMQLAFGTLLEDRTLENQSGQNNSGGFIEDRGVSDTISNSLPDSNFSLLNDMSTKDATSNEGNPDNPSGTSKESDANNADSKSSSLSVTGDITNPTPILQGIKDSELVDRLFPLILQKIDGATILKKISAQELLQKLDGQQLVGKVLEYVDGQQVVGKVMPYMDGQQLLEKVLPYMELKPIVTESKGQTATVKVSSAPYSTSGVFLKAECPTDQVPVSGGYVIHPGSTAEWSKLMKDGNEGVKNGYMIGATFPNSGTAESWVECLTIEVGVKP